MGNVYLNEVPLPSGGWFMLRLRALACVFTVGLISAFSHANDPVTIPVFPGSSQPPAQAVVSPAPAQAAPAQAKMAEPIPISPTMQGYGAGMMPPPLPPYAWPTYAPYNNFSRVAYPTAYPAEAFPFIGPFHPFPKVPPGWRSVKLEWDDGYWWFSKTANKHNWWKARFW